MKAKYVVGQSIQPRFVVQGTPENLYQFDTLPIVEVKTYRGYEARYRVQKNGTDYWMNEGAINPESITGRAA